MEMYLLKSAACLAILLVFYKAFLEKESFHTFKRFYLLGALLISFCIPLITLIKYVEPELVLGSFLNPIDEAIMYPSAVATAVTDEVVKQPFDWSSLLWTVYGLGVLFFGIRFIINLSRIVRKIKSNTKTKRESFINVLLKDLVIPHTFFNYIFLNKSKFEKQEIPEEVLLHEQTHAKQKHSIDILIIELLQVLFWFNPILYLIKKDIKLNHEFLADQAVMGHGTSLTTYQQILLAFSSNATEPYLANAINYSSIKKRFTVMRTQTSKKNLWVKSLVLLPLLTFMVYGFSTTKEIEKEVAPLLEINSTEKHPARSIDLKILEDGNYSVDGIKVNKNMLATAVNKLHQDITPEIRNNIMNINVSSSKEISKDEVWFIYNSLLEYGFYRIVTSNQEIVRGKGNTPFQTTNINQLISEKDKELFEAYPIMYIISKDEYYKNVTFKFRDKNKNILAVKSYFELTENEKYRLLDPPTKPMKRSPSDIKLNDWKDSTKYGVWLDGKRITNNDLNAFSNKDFSLYTVSKLEKNAINYGKHFYQVNLYTNSYFEELYSKDVKPLDKSVIMIIEQKNNTPTLNISNNGKTLTLNGINTSIKTLKKDFARITHGKKSELKITASKPFDIKLLETITNTITDKYLINLNLGHKTVIDERNGTINLQQPSREKVLGFWYNVDQNITFYIQENNRGLLWDIKTNDNYFVRYYPKKKDDKYTFTYNGSPWSFELKNDVIIDSKGLKFTRVDKPHGTQKEATSQQISDYNNKAKYYNAMLGRENFSIKMSDVKRLKYIYSIMSKKQKEDAEPFPDFPKPPPPPPASDVLKHIDIGEFKKPTKLYKLKSDSLQIVTEDYAKKYPSKVTPLKMSFIPLPTKEQIAEYNKLVKNYNAMTKNERSFKYIDIKRLKYIYSIMSKKQKEDAEPFPDFPKPPPPPPKASNISQKFTPDAKFNKSVKKINNLILKRNQILESSDSNNPIVKDLNNRIKEQKRMLDEHLKKLTKNEKANIKFLKDGEIVEENTPLPPPPPPMPPNATPAQKAKYQKVIDNYKDNIPPPPPPPKALPTIEELAAKGAVFYIEGEKVTSKKAIEYANSSKGKNLNMSVQYINTNTPTVKLSKKSLTVKRKY